MQENRRVNNYEDEIDLKELFITIWEKKIFVVVFTAIVTILAFIYVFFKNPIPVYQGKLYLEIGKIQDKNFSPAYIEHSGNLSNLLNIEFGINANLLKGTQSILELTYNSIEKEEIIKKLEEAKDYVITKHIEDTEFYEHKIMTKVIGKGVVISSEAINKPKKKLIVAVAFVTGFILSIFLVFFIQFVRTLKEEIKQ